MHSPHIAIGPRGGKGGILDREGLQAPSRSGRLDTDPPSLRSPGRSLAGNHLSPQFEKEAPHAAGPQVISDLLHCKSLCNGIEIQKISGLSREYLICKIEAFAMQSPRKRRFQASRRALSVCISHIGLKAMRDHWPTEEGIEDTPAPATQFQRQREGLLHSPRDPARRSHRHGVQLIDFAPGLIGG